MIYATSREFSRGIHSLGLTNADAEYDKVLKTTFWRFPGERRVAGEIQQDHNGRFHHLDEGLFNVS